MLEIKANNHRRWPRIVAFIAAAAIVAVGGYMLATVFSPTLPVLSGKSGDETRKKLDQAAGVYGNRLYIPQINVDIPILEGRDSGVLDKGAWYRKPENGSPIEGGNFVLSAHRFVMGHTPQDTVSKSPFYNLGKLKVGDLLFVDYKGKRYEYKVSDTYAVKPEGVEVESRTNEPQLTLYSATKNGGSDGRDVIEAHPVIKESKE